MTMPFDGLLELIGDRPGMPVRRPRAPEVARMATERKRKRNDSFPVVPNPWGLTSIQAEALRLLVEGERQVDLARKLCMSPKTLATHLLRAKEKMGVNSVLHAVLAYDRLTRATPVAEPAPGVLLLQWHGGFAKVEMRRTE